MRLWKRMKARMEHLNARVASAERLAADAEAEVVHSQERREHVQSTIIAPMTRAASHNQFADIIRASLVRQAARHVPRNGRA